MLTNLSVRLFVKFGKFKFNIGLPATSDLPLATISGPTPRQTEHTDIMLCM